MYFCFYDVHLGSSTEQVRTREDNIVTFIPTIGYQELSPEQIINGHNISEQPNDYAAFFEDETYPFYANEVEDMAPSFENIGTWENISENPHDVTNGIGLLLSNKYRPIKLDVPWTDFLLQWSRLFVSSSLEYSQGK